MRREAAPSAADRRWGAREDGRGWAHGGSPGATAWMRTVRAAGRGAHRREPAGRLGGLGSTGATTGELGPGRARRRGHDVRAGVDAQRRVSPVMGGPDNGVLGRVAGLWRRSDACQRSFKFPQVWSSKIPHPLLNTNNNYYACGRLWAGRFCGLSKSRWSRAARPRGRQRPQAAAPLTPRPPSV